MKHSSQSGFALSIGKLAGIWRAVQAYTTHGGNPKCWTDGFTFETCCQGSTAYQSSCWVWPYNHRFCCESPKPPRPPIQVGGRQSGNEDDASFSSTHRTARCRHEPSDTNLVACSKSLDEIGVVFESPVPGGGDKASGWHDYLATYERFLLHLPLNANVLEVGVRGGSSLALWSEYFPFGTTIGIDKNIGSFDKFRPQLERLGAFSKGNVRVVQANGTDPSVLEKLEDVGVSADFAHLIVDDANHWAADQIARFELLFPSLLRPGGVYIVEEVHIQPPFRHDGTAVREYFANISAASYLIEEEVLMGSHQIEAIRKASKNWKHQVESVSFLRDVIIVTKSP